MSGAATAAAPPRNVAATTPAAINESLRVRERMADPPE
jgi:hypothetical protein